MFTKLKGKEKKELMDLMAFIVAETQGAVGRTLVPKALADKISKLEPTFIKIQGDPDPAGNVSVFATSQGIAASGAPTGAVGTSATGAPDAPKQLFTLDEGVAVPESKRGGRLKADIYPFGDMKVGQSFFVAATEAKPNPAKGLQSTVSSANKRYISVFPATTGQNKIPHPKAGQPTGQDGRKFTVRPRTVADGETANGARVWRTA